MGEAIFHPSSSPLPDELSYHHDEDFSSTGIRDKTLPSLPSFSPLDTIAKETSLSINISPSRVDPTPRDLEVEPSASTSRHEGQPSDSSKKHKKKKVRSSL